LNSLPPVLTGCCCTLVSGQFAVSCWDWRPESEAVLGLKVMVAGEGTLMVSDPADIGIVPPSAAYCDHVTELGNNVTVTNDRGGNRSG
jgi:hypothetical protein